MQKIYMQIIYMQKIYMQKISYKPWLYLKNYKYEHPIYALPQEQGNLKQVVQVPFIAAPPPDIAPTPNEEQRAEERLDEEQLDEEQLDEEPPPDEEQLDEEEPPPDEEEPPPDEECPGQISEVDGKRCCVPISLANFSFFSSVICEETP